MQRVPSRTPPPPSSSLPFADPSSAAFGAGYRPQGYMAPPSIRDPLQIAPVGASTYDKGTRLVKLSRWVLLASVVLCFGSCGIATAGAPQALAALLLAVPGFVVAALIGTFGRGLQGRVV